MSILYILIKSSQKGRDERFVVVVVAGLCVFGVVLCVASPGADGEFEGVSTPSFDRRSFSPVVKKGFPLGTRLGGVTPSMRASGDPPRASSVARFIARSVARFVARAGGGGGTPPRRVPGHHRHASTETNPNQSDQKHAKQAKDKDDKKDKWKMTTTKKTNGKRERVSRLPAI
jgi:hypothetical protein